LQGQDAQGRAGPRLRTHRSGGPVMTVRTVMGWNLRQVMATHGMYQTSELVPLLAERGVHLSREHVYRLVARTPQRLNMEVLAALCDILDCEPNDLLVPTAVEDRTAKTGTGDAGPATGACRPTRPGAARPPEDGRAHGRGCRARTARTAGDTTGAPGSSWMRRSASAAPCASPAQPRPAPVARTSGCWPSTTPTAGRRARPAPATRPSTPAPP